MRDTCSRQYHRHRGLLLVALSVLLWACADTAQQPQQAETSPPPEQPAAEEDISLTLPPSQFSAQFNSVEQALARFNWMQASATLQEVEAATDLTLDDRIYLVYLQARIEFIRGAQDRALQQLASLHGGNPHPALRYRVLSFEHHIRELQGDAIETARLADQILRIAPQDTRDAWKRNIWRNLHRVDADRLHTAQLSATDPQWQAWLQLASVSRDNTATLKDELVLWRDSHPGHPAATPLPGGMDFLLQAQARNNVALLLPLSGPLAPAGKAVLEGYLSAYYAARGSQGTGGDILILDSDTYNSANTAYDDALAQGANMVVGPLDRDDVADLATRPERPVPVLALNRVEQVLPATGSALVQLSLAPEDEAVRIAEIAFGQGARSALVITPEGEWGRKVEQALRERWIELGGTVTANASYTGYNQEEYSSSLKAALGLADSEQRARDIRSMLATNIESTPRRRMDLDVVFLLSRNSAEARSIKPLLAFHYAGNLPVYAISSVYSGIPDERNRDLNGIKLVEIPWLLGANPALRAAIAAGDTGSDTYTRLNALGADAYLLQANFPRLQSGADALLRGNTGLLGMDPQLRIQRELPLATIDGGALQPR